MGPGQHDSADRSQGPGAHTKGPNAQRPGHAAPRSRILGTGHYVPSRILSNRDLERMVDTSDAWIVERTGIRERRIAAEGEASSDMAAEAARRALEAAGIQATDLDLIVVATVTPDRQLPSTAVFV